MPFVVSGDCIRCKYTDCVEVCPVDCFHEGMNMLVIDPDECIDCGICEPECPIKAILPDSHEPAQRWLPINAEYAAKWPVIRKRRAPPHDAKSFEGRQDKYEELFNPLPAARG